MAWGEQAGWLWLRSQAAGAGFVLLRRVTAAPHLLSANKFCGAPRTPEALAVDSLPQFLNVSP